MHAKASRSKTLSNAPSRLAPLLVLILGGVGIGFAPVLGKLAVVADAGASLTRLSPVAVAFWRMALAAPIFFALAPRGRGGTTWHGVLATTVPGGLFAIDLALWHWAFEYTTVANATLEANFAAILVPVFSWFMFGERFSALFVLGAALAIGGMGRLVGAGVGNASQWVGDLLGIGTALAYTGYQLSTKWLVTRMHPLRFMAWVSTACALGLAVLALITPGHFVPVTARAWAYIATLAVVSQLIGQGCIALAMRSLPAALAAVVLLVQPLVAAILGWVMLGQSLTPGQLWGGGFLLGGIGLARMGKRPPLPERECEP